VHRCGGGFANRYDIAVFCTKHRLQRLWEDHPACSIPRRTMLQRTHTDL